MYKAYEFCKHIFLICYVKVMGVCKELWNKMWNKKEIQQAESFPEDSSEISLITEDNYNSLFIEPTSESRIFMPKQVFDKMVDSLPADYSIPCQQSLNTLNDNIFNLTANQRQEVLEDNHVWEKVKASLPADYVLKNPFVFKDDD